MLTRKYTTRRRGFTLVELMVAAALAITIMWILSESFKMGIDFARTAHSTGDMMTQLNNAGQIMTRDLQAQHFYSPGALRNISVPMPDNLLGYTPPAGYVQVVSPQSSFIMDDSTQFMITTNTGCQIACTVYLPQGLPQNLFSVTSPAGVTPYSSQAAEVIYFLSATGSTTPPLIVTPVMQAQQGAGLNPAGQPLYNLYRRQRLVAPTSDYINQYAAAIAADPNVLDVISITPLPGGPQVNTLSSFGNAYPGPTRVSRVPAVPLGGARTGDDILLSNVLSFEVLATWNPCPPSSGVTNPVTKQAIPYPTPYTPVPPNTAFNTNYPFDNLSQASLSLNPAFQNTFDTWFAINQPNPQAPNNPALAWNWNNFAIAPNNPNLIPMPIRITGLQITIRIYDPNTHQARQNTWRIAM